jgi:hypothetical protein
MFPGQVSPILSYFPAQFSNYFLRNGSNSQPKLQISKPDKVYSLPHQKHQSPRRPTHEMAQPLTPFISTPLHKKDHGQKEAAKFDVIAAYKGFVNDPDVSHLSSRLLALICSVLWASSNTDGCWNNVRSRCQSPQCNPSLSSLPKPRVSHGIKGFIMHLIHV